MLVRVAAYVVLLFTTGDSYEITGTSKDRVHTRDTLATIKLTSPNYGDFSLEDVREYNSTNVSLNTFLLFLMNVSILQLENVHKNIKRDYRLNQTEMKFIDNAFENCNWEYERTLKMYFKKSFSNISNTSKLSLSDFADFSHFIIQKTVDSNLKLLQDELLSGSKSSVQFLKHKILRQQMKIVMNIIDNQICWNLTLCMKRNVYTDYLVEWLRYMLNASGQQLNNFFLAIPLLIDKYMHVIRTNVKFRQKIKYFVRINDEGQRDFIDFLDEILTNEDEIFNIMQNESSKGNIFYAELFQLIDDNYSLNDENNAHLDGISKKLFEWTSYNNYEIKKILDSIMHNMELNIKIWPLAEQNRLDYIWSQILTL